MSSSDRPATATSRPTVTSTSDPRTSHASRCARLARATDRAFAQSRSGAAARAAKSAALETRTLATAMRLIARPPAATTTAIPSTATSNSVAAPRVEPGRRFSLTGHPGLCADRPRRQHPDTAHHVADLDPHVL